MKNFWSIFAAYLAAWFIFLVYDWTVSRRLARLREQLDRLKERLRQD
jgi:CcmD family protein